MSLFNLFGGHHGSRNRRGRDGYGYQPAAQPAPAPAQSLSACRACGAGNAAEARFCSQCGQRVGPVPCAACAQPLSPGARFCAACGTAAA